MSHSGHIKEPRSVKSVADKSEQSEGNLDVFPDLQFLLGNDYTVHVITEQAK